MRGIGSGRGLMPSLLHLFGATRPWQFGDVGRDPPSLIMRECARLARLVLVFAEVDVGERLAVRVGHDERLLKLADGPGRGKAAERAAHGGSIDRP